MLHASNRRRKLFIPVLKKINGLAISQQQKEEVVFNPGFTLPLVTGLVTAVTSLTGLDR
jgi:hypothetical protein